MSSKAIEMYKEVLRKNELRVLKARFWLQVADLESDIPEVADFASKSLFHNVKRIRELEESKQ